MGRLSTRSGRRAFTLSPARRARRSAAEAHGAILDAAERRLSELGPAGLRLQQIAADVGISHPAVLHHFGTREQLLEAVIRRSLERLELDLMHLLARPGGDSTLDHGDAVLTAIQHAFTTIVGRGHGRVLAWLLLSGEVPAQALVSLQRLAEFAHQRRQEATPAARISFEDTRFRVLLVAMSVLGESVAGPAVQQSLGVRSVSERRRFHAWLVRMLAPPEARRG